MKKRMIIAAIGAGAFILVSFLCILALGVVMPSVKQITSSPEQDRYAHVDGYRLRYRTTNLAKPPIVMLHGFANDLSTWEKLSSTITCANAISLDLIGFGLSDKPAINYNFESHRKYLLAFLDALHIQKTVLVGTSMGASIALYTAAKSPERVAGVVAFAPSGYPDSMRHAWPADYFYKPGAANRILRAIVGTKLFRALFPNSLGIQALDVANTYNFEYVNLLPSIQQPVLLIWSRGDKRIPFIYSRRYKELLKNWRFIEAPEQAGHGAASHPTPEMYNGICSLIAEAQF